MNGSNDRILPGVILMLGFCVFAPFIDASAKLASETLPVGQITTARYIVQFALMLGVVLMMRQPFSLSRQAAILTFWRALVSVLATFSFVWAVSYMPLADALAIAFVEPFVLLLCGKILFGEDVGPRRIAACAVAFLGALLVIQPSFQEFGWVALLPLFTAFSFAAYMLITRQAASVMTPEAMQLHTAWMGGLICAPLMIWGMWQGTELLNPLWPEGWAWMWLFGIGAASTFSHMLMSYALKFAPAASLAPLHYLEIVSAASLGYLVFGDFPNGLTWLGIAIIVSSGLYVIHRERVQLQAARQAPVAAG